MLYVLENSRPSTLVHASWLCYPQVTCLKAHGSGQEGHEALTNQRSTTDDSTLDWYCHSSQKHLGVHLVDEFVCTLSCSECPVVT